MKDLKITLFVCTKKHLPTIPYVWTS